jgi:hypothetical protein
MKRIADCSVTGCWQLPRDKCGKAGNLLKMQSLLYYSYSDFIIHICHLALFTCARPSALPDPVSELLSLLSDICESRSALKNFVRISHVVLVYLPITAREARFPFPLNFACPYPPLYRS